MRRLVISACLAVLALSAAVAEGELVQESNLRVAFEGSIVPRALPRERLAPVKVHLNSSIATVDGSRPPQLRKVTIAVNRTGHLFLAGLPSCTSGQLAQTDTDTALELCRRALVGHGTFEAAVNFGNGPLIPVRGKSLIFNGRVGKKRAMLMHIYNAVPVRLTFIVPFVITHRDGGSFGTVLSARIPRIASDRGYVTGIQLTLKRRYVFRGERRSVFSANCAAPVGFPGAPFTLAKAAFAFENGKRLTVGLVRDCVVR